MENKVTAKNYTLRTDNGGWLGQVVLTSDGAFMSITDYGNFSFAWRSTGTEDFRKFIIKLDKQYFAGKMANGTGYIAYGKNVNKAAELFAEKILSPLQEALKAEIEAENNATPKIKCIRDRRKGCNQCHDCDIEVLNPNY